MAKSKGKIIAPYVIGDKNHPWRGLNTATKDNRDMDVGESYDQLNWLTGRDQDNIQLRRGQALLGTTRRNIANEHVSGMGVGILPNGTQVPFYSFAKKIMYYDSVAGDTKEVSTTDILPVDDEDISINQYANNAGVFMYLSSPNSSIYKIPVANPQSVVDQKTTFKFGYFKFDQGRMIACNRKGSAVNSNSIDKTGLYISHVDTQLPTTSYMALPPAPTATVVLSGGNIADGTYYYVITAIGLNGTETTKGAQSLAVVVSGGGGNAKINLSWVGVAGASSYNIYRTTSSGVYNTPALINQYKITTNSFSDIFLNPFTGAPPYSTTQSLISAIATGDGSTKTFTGTLPDGGAPLTLFGLTITDGNEIFNDDMNGNLIGSLGGTGTINYATQAYSVTFNTAPTSGTPITASFFYENATINGVADFALNPSDTSAAQEFPQGDSGSSAQSIFSYQGVEYCLHILRSWQFTLSASTTFDQAFANLPYYEQIGIPYVRAAFQTNDGIIFLNNSTPANPQFSILQIPPGSTNLTVVPVKLSEKLDLSPYGFQKCVVARWGDFDIVAFQVANQYGQFNGYNSYCFVRNIWSGLWNKLDYEFTCLSEFVGTLISGDSLSPNVFTLFSGFDDDGQVIENYYNHAFLNLEIDGLKKVGYLHVEGLIQNPQNVQVGIALDGGNYTTEYVILGNADYVNKGSSVGIGTYTMGSNLVGGEGSASQFANKFEVDIPIHTDLFEYISFQFQALQVGYFQVNKVSFKDIRFKRRRLISYEDPEIDE